MKIALTLGFAIIVYIIVFYCIWLYRKANLDSRWFHLNWVELLYNIIWFSCFFSGASATLSTLLVPVIFSMLGLVVVLAGAAYIVRLRKKSDVEVANFDFHPDMDSSGSHIFSRFRRSVSGLFQRNEYIRRHRLAKYQRTSAKSYGAVEELWWLVSSVSCWRERKYIYMWCS